MVDRVLEHPGNGTVVFGSDEQKTPGRSTFALQPLDRLGLVRVVVLVVKRQVADLHLLERKLRRRQFHDGIRQLTVIGIPAKTADHNGDWVLTHGDLQNKLRRRFAQAPRPLLSTYRSQR